jgi:hypothetical protein
MTLDPAQAARLDGSASATSHIVKTDPCAWCSVLVRSPNLRAITLEQHKHQKWVLLAVWTNVACVQNWGRNYRPHAWLSWQDNI